MNEQQVKALESLSRAFRRCKKAKLSFVGMDGSIRAFDTKELSETLRHGTVCDQQYVKNGNQGYPVDSHGTYLDSGGW